MFSFCSVLPDYDCTGYKHKDSFFFFFKGPAAGEEEHFGAMVTKLLTERREGRDSPRCLAPRNAAAGHIGEETGSEREGK